MGISPVGERWGIQYDGRWPRDISGDQLTGSTPRAWASFSNSGTSSTSTSGSRPGACGSSSRTGVASSAASPVPASNRRRRRAPLSATRTGSPGSLMSTWPRRSRLTRAASLSAHLTRRPRDARHAAVVRPTYLHRSRRRGSLVSARIAPCSRRSPQGCGHSDTTTARRSFRSVRSAVCDPFRGTRRPCGRAHRPRVRTAPSRAVHERE